MKATTPTAAEPDEVQLPLAPVPTLAHAQQEQVRGIYLMTLCVGFFTRGCLKTRVFV